MSKREIVLFFGDSVRVKQVCETENEKERERETEQSFLKFCIEAEQVKILNTDRVRFDSGPQRLSQDYF